MAVKTFTTGEVLTAADTNTYLNNGGLVYITETSVTSGSTISISNCFTSTYTNYRIIGYNIATSGQAAMAFQLQASGTPAQTNYNQQRFYAQDSTTGAAYTSGQTNWNFGYVAASQVETTIMELFNPQAATNTRCSMNQVYLDNSKPYIDIRNGLHTTAAAYDGFRVTTTDTFSAGTIVVFGYRKA